MTKTQRKEMMEELLNNFRSRMEFPLQSWSSQLSGTGDEGMIRLTGYNEGYVEITINDEEVMIHSNGKKSRYTENFRSENINTDNSIEEYLSLLTDKVIDIISEVN